MAIQTTAWRKSSKSPSLVSSPPASVSPLIMLFLVLAVGCDQTRETVQAEKTPATEATGHYVSATASPGAIIDECVDSYRRLTSYQDSAYVELKYRIGEKWHQDRAPLSVAWSKAASGEPSKQLLGFRVYSTLAGPDGDRWRARIARSDLAESNQVVSRAIPKRVDFSWLLDDSVIAQSLSAGLAGFPPQLDLLLSDEPLSGLVNDAAQLKLMRADSVNGRLCHVVAVEVAGRSYRLWIDQASMLLRRLVMPQQNVPRELLDSQGVEDVQLSVELASIEVGESIDWSRYRVKFGPEDFLVNHFVAPPVQWDTGGLGVQVPAFRLKNSQGISVFETGRDSRPGQPEIKVLLWLANHPSSQLAAEQVAMVADLVDGNADLDGRVRFVPIWAEPTPPAGLSFDQLRAEWELPGEVAVDTEAVGRDLFQVEEAPTLVVLDKENRIQLRETSSNPMLAQFLPKILVRLTRGVDIASEFIEDARNVSRRSVAELKAALAIDNNRPISSKGGSDYWPQWVEIIRSNTKPVNQDLVTACLDSSAHVWTLDRKGTLTNWSTVGKEVTQKQSWGGVAVPSSSSRIRVETESGLVAITNSESSRLKIFDTGDGRGFDVAISSEDQVNDLEWVRVASDARPRLAVTTKKSWLLLIDPANQEQLSARCPAPPVAILPRPLESNEVGGVVVLEDRTVQPIRVSTPETTQSLSVDEGRQSGEDPTRKSKVVLIGYQSPIGSEASAESTLLPFQPSGGGWQRIEMTGGSYTLARGWLAKDEPAAFLLDSKMKPLWHRRLPLLGDGDTPRDVSGSVDPKSGQPVWSFTDADQTIHLFRADGLADHFKFRESVLDVALKRLGSELNMCVVLTDRIEVFRLAWR